MSTKGSSFHQHLAKAPIHEAVLHIRSGLDHSKEEKGQPIPFKPSVEEIEKNGMRFARQIHFREKALPFIDVSSDRDEVVGDRFESEDRKWVLQWFRDGGVALSRLAPYASWEEFFGFSKTIFACAIPEAEIFKTRMVGLRYINRFPIASPDDLFKKFFQPSGDDPGVDGYVRGDFVSLNKFQIPSENATLTIAKNLLRQIQNGIVSFFGILDIDVVATPRGISSWEDVWNLVGRLRMLKNNAFFAQFKPEGLEAFK